MRSGWKLYYLCVAPAAEVVKFSMVLCEYDAGPAVFNDLLEDI